MEGAKYHAEEQVEFPARGEVSLKIRSARESPSSLATLSALLVSAHSSRCPPSTPAVAEPGDRLRWRLRNHVFIGQSIGCNLVREQFVDLVLIETGKHQIDVGSL
jgi:hypothetical protein